MAHQSELEAWMTWAFSPTISAIIVTVIIAFTLPALIHLYLYRKAVAKEAPSFLLVGASGAGKTSLLTLLSNGSSSPTYTSQSPSTAFCQLPAEIRSSEDQYRSENDNAPRDQPEFEVIDTPGHGKLRHHAFSSLAAAKALKGIIFVVDSAAVSSPAGLTEAAEYLHDILLVLQKRHTQAKTSKGPASIPVLVAANKQDVFSSLPTGMVRTKLEQEIGRLRQTKSKGVMDSGFGSDDSTGGDDDEQNWLGEFGSNQFKFTQMEEHGVDVNVVGGNVKGDGQEKGHIEGWWVWIGENL